MRDQHELRITDPLEEAIDIAVSIWREQDTVRMTSIGGRDRLYQRDDGGARRAARTIERYQQLKDDSLSLTINKIMSDHNKQLVAFLLENHPFVILIEKATPETDQWCQDNTTGAWHKHAYDFGANNQRGKIAYKFSNERDVTLFKMFWYQK